MISLIQYFEKKVLVGFTINIRLISSLGLGPWVRQILGGGGGGILYCVPHLRNRVCVGGGGACPPGFAPTGMCNKTDVILNGSDVI